ncbi:hypothetical protein E3E12_02150 [Formicincola oecophyllae]|uniref:Uncharacterized protein n=1 Tax=Formicincola oecophyllae TaxID=2558361 RepID=A0A4Y6U9S0_9PROT|nr:hypothetical protein [Formicincola oecophyllae]QDH13196.1 hypothetical protein E3E12_02150 [Formicincola oecophyllae]
MLNLMNVYQNVFDKKHGEKIPGPHGAAGWRTMNGVDANIRKRLNAYVMENAGTPLDESQASRIAGAYVEFCLHTWGEQGTGDEAANFQTYVQDALKN